MTTPAADDAVERAFEAVLAGRPVPSAESDLTAFTEAVRASATRPGRPSAALAELLATGLLTDQPSPSTRTVRSAGRDVRRAPARSRRRRLRMLAPTLLAKLASAGLAAKAATVAGVAVVGFSTAGFVGALPTPAQHAFATVVDHATPFTAPSPELDSGDQTSTSTSTDATDSSTDATDGQPTVTGDNTSTTGTSTGETPAAPTPFGQQISQMAHANKAAGQHPGVDGKTVSEMARAKHSAATDDPSNGDTADQSGDGDTADQSGDTETTDQSGDGDTADQSGDGSGDTGVAPATAGGSSRHGKGGGAGHGDN